MAFAQLTYRESLRDIEACLSALPNRLYHMGIRGNVSRSTLADANEQRDWRIYADFAQGLIAEARRLYAGEPLDLDLEHTVYALDATIIEFCIELFPWARFQKHVSGVKLHTLLDLRGPIPAFARITAGNLADSHILDVLTPEPGSIYVFDRAYLDFVRLRRLNQAKAIFVTRAKKNQKLRRIYSRPVDRSTGLICDQTVVLAIAATARSILSNCAGSATKTRKPAGDMSSSPTTSICRRSRSPSSTSHAGASSSSSSGSSSTSGSRRSTGEAPTPSAPRSGSPFPCT
jgi:hypothetical protein